MSYYRIKTEEEFTQDFGEDWRHSVTIDSFGAGWNPKKDVLFGKEVPENIILRLKEATKDKKGAEKMRKHTEWHMLINSSSYHWRISWNMITEESEIEF